MTTSYPSTRGGGYYMNVPSDPDAASASERASRAASEQVEDTAAIAQVAAAQAAPGPSGYGPPAATAPRETNYISDDGLLAWLAAKQEGLYGDLRDRMDVSEARSKFIEDLTHLKAYLDSGDATTEGAASEVKAFITAYEGTAFEGEVQELFAPSLHDALVVYETESTSERRLDFDLSGGDFSLSKNERKKLSEDINAATDALARNDQLELIRINSLSSAINQAAQLASNLLSSSNQTANTIVGNIGR